MNSLALFICVVATATCVLGVDPLEPECRWELFLHDDFIHGGQAWSNPKTTNCAGNTLLGGYNAVRENRPQGEVFTHVTGLPPHTHVRVKANYYYIDSWDREFGYMKLEDRVVWTKDCWGCASRGQNFCGNRFPDTLAEAVDVVIPHRRAAVKVSFGANLDEHTRNESYAIGNFFVYFFDCEQYI